MASSAILTFSLDDFSKPLEWAEAPEAVGVDLLEGAVLVQLPQGVLLRRWPLVDEEAKRLEGRLIAIYQTHFFLAAGLEVIRYSSKGEVQGRAMCKEGDRPFVVTPDEAVVVGDHHLAIWEMTQNGATLTRSWNCVLSQHELKVVNVVDVKKAHETYALVCKSGLPTPYLLRFFHPALEKFNDQAVNSPDLAVIGSTFYRITHYPSVRFLQRNMEGYQPIKASFPEERETDLAPLGSRSGRGSIGGSNAALLVARYRLETEERLLFRPLDGHGAYELPASYQGRIRLFLEGSFALIEERRIRHYEKIGEETATHWGLDKGIYLDVDLRSNGGVALIDDEGTRLIRSLEYEKSTPPTASCLDPTPSRPSTPELEPSISRVPPPPSPFPKGKVALACITLLLLTYCLVHIWRRREPFVPVEAPPLPSLPPPPIPAPPKRPPVKVGGKR
ncbi:MAG: hypothetical protein AB7F31_01860 [Parachlamydiales bacterium]